MTINLMTIDRSWMMSIKISFEAAMSLRAAIDEYFCTVLSFKAGASRDFIR